MALAEHDVYLDTDDAYGQPFGLLQAMAAGCIPVVASRPNLAGVVLDGLNGFLVPPGDVSSMTERLALLHADQGRRQEMSAVASRSIAALGLRPEDMARAIATRFDVVLEEARAGRFRRPAGLLHKPPFHVAGTEVLPVAYFRGIAGVGIFPSYREDYEDYRAALGIPDLPAFAPELVQPHPVVLGQAATAERYSTLLAERLRAADHPVERLDEPMAGPILRPLRLRRVVQWLAARGPCFYLPPPTGLLAALCSRLPPSVSIIGRVDSADRDAISAALGRAASWDAVVAGDVAIAELLLEREPQLAARLVVIPLPGEVTPGRRPLRWNLPLRVAHGPVGPRWPAETPARLQAMLAQDGVPVTLMPLPPGSPASALAEADVWLALEEGPLARLRLHDAMRQGCAPLAGQGDARVHDYVIDGRSGLLVPDGDLDAVAERLRQLQRNAALRGILGANALLAASQADQPALFTASYQMLFEQVLRERERGGGRRIQPGLRAQSRT